MFPPQNIIPSLILTFKNIFLKISFQVIPTGHSLLMISVMHRLGNWGVERLQNFPKVILPMK